MKRIRRLCSIAFTGGDPSLVERPGPGLAPTAFRIWAAGLNMSDYGPAYFTARSAGLLIDQQAQRENLFSFDFNHLSLTDDGQAEGKRAAGWHRIETRPDANGALELWACAIEWCEDVKAGIEAKPPHWRFFSPAFDTDPETFEVTRYLNTAITINPATWGNTDLATAASISSGENQERDMKMTKAERDTLAVLNAMHELANAEGGDDAQKAVATAMYAAKGGADAHAKLKAMDCDEEDAAAPASSDDPPPTSKSPGDAPAKTTAPAAAAAVTVAAKAPTAAEVASMDAFTRETTTRLAAVEREAEALRADARAARVEKILATRKDLTPAMRASLRKLGSPTKVQELVDGIPRPDVKAAAPAPGAGTRGAPQTESAADERDPKAREAVRRALNINGQNDRVGWSKPQNGLLVLTSMTPAEARARAQAGKKAS